MTDKYLLTDKSIETYSLRRFHYGQSTLIIVYIYCMYLQSYFSNSIYCVMILPRTSSIYKNYEDGISRRESMFSAYRMGPVASRCGLWNIDSLEKSMKISNKLFDIFMDFSRPSIFHYGSPSYESSVSLHRSRTPWMTS